MLATAATRAGGPAAYDNVAGRAEEGKVEPKREASEALGHGEIWGVAQAR